MSNIKKSLLVADVHGYEHDPKVKSIILQIAKDLKPDYLGLLGDMIDCEGVSKFTASEWKNGAYDTAKEINYFREQYFLPLIKACNNKAMKIKMCLGNHENRIFDFLDKIKKKECEASYKDWKNKFNLEKMFPEADIKPYNECHKIGKLYLTHGEFHNLAHPRKHATVYGRNIVYGHLHTWAVTTVATKADNSINSAYSIPCACKLNPSYMKNKSSAWVQGCAVAYILPNGDYYLVPIIIINNKTIFNGKIYYAK